MKISEETPSQWAVDSLDKIQAAGYRCGSARMAVIDLLARQKCCFSAKEINTELSSNEHKIGLASVYRTLDLLKELDLIASLELGDGTAYYELKRPDGEHHHHILCKICNRMESFHDIALEKRFEEISKNSTFKAVSHEVTLRGICPDCQS